MGDLLQCIERLLTEHLVEDRTNLCVRSSRMRGALYTHAHNVPGTSRSDAHRILLALSSSSLALTNI
jgi:hypothetical protein